MIRPGERWLFAIVFLALVLFAVYQDYVFTAHGFNVLTIIWLVLSGFILAGPSRLFLKIVSRMFLDPAVTSTRLHDFSSERSRIISESQGSNRDEYQDVAALVTNTLKFAESWVKGWAKGSHFEFCVFLDKDMPLLFAYFDSNKDVNPRSRAARKANPIYYREAGYEVVKLLEEPTSVPRIISNTARSPYVFTSTNQESQINSTILLLADVAEPCALVVTSNKKKAFREKDEDLLLFVKFVAETVYCDLRQRDFIHRVRALRPELFAIKPKPH